ncbi:uncharacterized protein (TIGR02300 family) [Tepidamorphus gemmatus]|jgi:uncharacterized protein (TIGR02300 family)|uniref:Uncharacterized protein (TIGR02300 family) n=1 Tax=Tepidamorphus gemmatus TaxID=747076 RepID=A0A4R3MC28_9HYPH|nr:TIGR02300 family protein [Tepidamorphus gemmatus]TCT10692.1 uncharacterized protein (TIGR02300 family) [Tepidamorphus gemmatus]
MAKPELGTKRICGACGTRFYDLMKDPIVCPKCGTIYDVAVIAARTKPATAKPAAEDAEDLDEEEQDEALVALEDADAEEEDTGRADPEIDDDEIPDLEDEDIGDDADDEFLPDDEDEGDDVSVLIEGDIEGDEET